jgi:23S rRNA pseudouridine1911/1915/1917 synthase
LITADRGDGGERLDRVLRRRLRDVRSATRTQLQKWIAGGLVTVNGAAVRRPAARVSIGDRLVVALPDSASTPQALAEELPLDILFEDDHLLAVDKPAGMVVHPGYRNRTRTLLSALLWHARRWPAGARPSIVGRLDKLTSGVVLVAKTAAMHAALQRELASAESVKSYVAIVYGRVSRPRGRIVLPLARDAEDRRKVIVSDSGGRPSITRFERIARVDAPPVGLSLLRCDLLTGRMHQIRVHLAARGWSIVGDPTYGEARWGQMVDRSLAETLSAFDRQALHAWRITLRHPAIGRRMTFESPLPNDFANLLTAAQLPVPGSTNDDPVSGEQRYDTERKRAKEAQL